EVNRETFTQTPSRLTAESMEREERAAFLKAVSEYGYVDNYTGIRISSTGRRFYIMQATVWNLTDDNDVFHGQAAAFRQFRYIE
ncbi:MEKHLA domain-containing protein, partial [Paenibacillus glucanolyticus]